MVPRARLPGLRISVNIETAEDAVAGGDQIVFGAPNIVRGKSINARDMVARGLCSILASDYFYPAPLVAASGWRRSACCRSPKPGNLSAARRPAR